MIALALALFQGSTFMSLWPGWPPRFLPLLLERLGLNPFGGSCEGGWDEFADVRFTCFATVDAQLAIL